MKKSVLSFFVLSCAFCPLTHALTDIEISGEVDLVAQVYTLPTGLRGDSAFLIPSFLLDVNIPLQEGNALFASLEGAEKRDSASGRMDVQTRELFLDVVSVFEGLHALRLGLIPQPWLESQYQNWNYRFLGKSGRGLTERFGYYKYSDLGGSFMSELPGDGGEWAFTITNGEGLDENETGPHKEFSFFARITKVEPWTISINYTRGHYEAFSEGLGLKERVQAQVIYQGSEDWVSGVELLDSHDPADIVERMELADGVDVAPWIDQSIHGRGGSLFCEVSTGPKANLLIRYDYLNPVLEASDRTLQSYVAALSYRVTEDIQSALAFDYTMYGKDYGPGVRDQSKIEVATQVLF